LLDHCFQSTPWGQPEPDTLGDAIPQQNLSRDPRVTDFIDNPCRRYCRSERVLIATQPILHFMRTLVAKLDGNTPFFPEKRQPIVGLYLVSA